jgi:hypothetical protein
MTHKDEVITFKVDEALAEQLRLMPNRSEFIRQAVLQALNFECPLCHGAGTLTPNQMKHWEAFSPAPSPRHLRGVRREPHRLR